VLVLVEGRTEVVSDRSLDSEPYRGALRIIDREELVKRLGGTDLSERELEEQAAALDTAVSEMGG
jgi:NADH dehydrogenase